MAVVNPAPFCEAGLMPSTHVHHKPHPQSSPVEVINPDGSLANKLIKVYDVSTPSHSHGEERSLLKQSIKEIFLSISAFDEDKLNPIVDAVIKADPDIQPSASMDRLESIARAWSVFLALPENCPDIRLPSEAPEIYVGNRGGKKGGESIVEFMRRVWMPWIAAGILTRPDLRRLDPKAAQALANFERTSSLPDDLPLPSRVKIKAIRAAKTANDPDALGLLKSERRRLAALERSMGVGR
jgi:hypothetical protein